MLPGSWYWTASARSCARTSTPAIRRHMHESLQISDMDMNMFGLNAAQLESAGARWTAQVILQQPEVWSEIQAQIAGQSAPLAGFIDPWLMDPSSRIILTGAGTSAHIGGC